jgi:hypothetical protein
MAYSPVSRVVTDDGDSSACEQLKESALDSWPDGPRRLESDWLVLFLCWFWDILLTIGPIFFIGKASSTIPASVSR